jgi:hypothetical protein
MKKTKKLITFSHFSGERKIIRNKSAMSLNLVVQSVILVAILASLIFIFNQLRVKSQTAAEMTECIASIEAHASFVEAQLVKTEVVDASTVGIGSLFIDSTADPPPIKCDTKLIKSKSKTKEKMEDEIISSVVKNWFLFKEGKKAFYPGLEKKNFCFVADVIEFKEIPEMELYSASQRITMQQALNSYNGPETVLEYFDEYDLRDNNIVLSRALASKNFFTSFQIYYPGDIQKFKEKENEVLCEKMSVKGYFEFVFSAGETSVKNSVNMKQLSITFLDKLDLRKSYEFPTNVPYAVIFFQTHDYPSKLANIVGDEFYPFIFSAIMVIPYTEDAMSQIQCDYMPVEFQN